MYERKSPGVKSYQFVTDKYKACVLVLICLLGNEAEKSLLRLVIRAVGNPLKMGHFNSVLHAEEIFKMNCCACAWPRLLWDLCQKFRAYCGTCAEGTGVRSSWTLTPVWPPRLQTRLVPPDIRHPCWLPYLLHFDPWRNVTLGVLVPSAFLICWANLSFLIPSFTTSIPFGWSTSVDPRNWKRRNERFSWLKNQKRRSGGWMQPAYLDKISNMSRSQVLWCV